MIIMAKADEEAPERYHMRIPVTIVTAVFASAMVVLLTPVQQAATSVAPGMSRVSGDTSSVVQFPIVNRADFDDPASGIVNLDLFDDDLLSDDRHALILRVPFPTGAFWTNLVVQSSPDGLSDPVVAYPLSFKWADSILQLSYAPMTRRVDTIAVTDYFQPHVTFGSVETMTKRHVLNFDPLSVTLRYVGEETSRWETYLVQGSPYFTAKYTDTTPVLKTLSTFYHVMCGSSSSSSNNSGGKLETKDLEWSDCATPSSVRRKSADHLLAIVFSHNVHSLTHSLIHWFAPFLPTERF
jgi:hypothetical protein